MAAILSDNFNDNSIDTSAWDPSTLDFDAGVTVSETGQQLVITPLTSTAGTKRNGLQSDNTFNFTQGFAVWKLDQKAGANANVETRCGVFLDASNYLSFQVANTTLTFRKRAGASNSDTTLTYNSTNHKYLMIHHVGASATWYTSPDGAVWTAQRSNIAPGFAVTALKMFFDCGTIASVATITPSTAVFDDVQIGTLDLLVPWEQLAQFGRFVDLIIDPGCPLNIVPDGITTGDELPELTEGQEWPLAA